MQQRGDVAALNLAGEASGHHLVHDHAEAVDVGALVGAGAANLFGRGIERGIVQQVGLRLFDQPNQAEVGQAGASRFVEQDIARFDVAVDHASPVGIA